MAQVYLRKVSATQWAPANDPDTELLAKYKVGQMVRFNEAGKRSLLEHNLFWAFLNFCFANQGYYKTMGEFRTNLFLRIGYGTFQRAKANGMDVMIFHPGSVKFENCSQQDFHKMFQDAITYIKEKMGIDLEEWKSNQTANSVGHFKNWLTQEPDSEPESKEKK